jgi:hypothetical protein
MPYKIDPKTGKQKRGFAAMSVSTRRKICSLGGKASHGGGRKPKPKEVSSADLHTDA